MIVKNPDCGSVGLIKDVSPWEIPPAGWSAASNFRFRNGFAERAQGHLTGYGTVAAVPYGLFPCVDGSGNKYLVYPGLTTIHAAQGTTHYDISRSVGGAYGATADKRWTGGVLTGIVVVNNGVDDPQFWVPQTGGNMAALTNWPASTKCNALRVFRNYLIAMDVTSGGTRYPYQVMWSAGATSGTLPAWTAASTNDAGSYDLGDSSDIIVDGWPLADQFAIYRQNSVYMMRYIAGSNVMAFGRIPNVPGILANNCVDQFPGGHVVFGPSDVYLFNGTSASSIIDGRMRKWLFSNISSSYYARSFVVTNPTESEAWICFPAGASTSCDMAIVWNWKENTLGVRDMPNATCAVFTQSSQTSMPTWASESGTWADATDTWASDASQSLAENVTLIGSANTKIYIVGAAETFDGTAITGLVERSGISMGDAERLKFVKSVWPRIDGTAGDTVEITIGTQMQVDEPVSWKVAKTYTIGSSRKVDVNALGRFIAIRYRSSGAKTWKISSFDVEVQLGGLY